MKNRIFLSSLAIAASVLLSACNTEVESQPPMPAPQVTVAEVIHHSINDWSEFSGRLEAPETVELKPRVSGYIDMVAFEEGAYVSAGDTLFLIDNEPYKAEVKRLAAELTQAKSQLELAKSEFERAKSLSKQKAISDDLYDKRQSNLQQSFARIDSISAALERAKLDRGYTRVEAPISGRVSRAFITKGNYVTAGESLLTTIVSTDKVYAWFDADERSFLNFQQQAKVNGSKELTVFMGLTNEQNFPHAGTVDFVDNRVNPQTGTISVRATFDNSQNQFVPGLFARLLVSTQQSREGILIDDKAVATDLANKYVLVLDEQNLVQYRPVTLGQKVAGLRVINSGLNPGEKVVTNGLQRVRPGSPVTATSAPMTSEENIEQLTALSSRVTQNKQLAKTRSGSSNTVGG